MQVLFAQKKKTYLSNSKSIFFFSEGLEQYCPKGVEVYNDKHPSGHWNYGGFADSIRVDHRFVFHVPEAIPSEFAAPLLCAGQTVYSPLKKFTKPGDTIGVIGIGG